MKKIILLMVVINQLVFAVEQEGTGSVSENTTSNNVNEYIQVCINGGEEGTSGEQVNSSTTTVCTIVQVQPSTSG